MWNFTQQYTLNYQTILTKTQQLKYWIYLIWKSVLRELFQ